MDYDPALARAILIRTPDVLRTWLLGLPAEWLDAPEGPGAWSPRDVACHLADLEHDGWLPRIRTLLEAGMERPFSGIERERFRERFAGAPLGVVLDEFAAVRTRNIEALDALGSDAALLAARGRHPVFGEVSLAQLLSTWVVHDLTHLAQISRALAAQYREAVGPWIRNLSVLRARGAAEERAAGDAG